MWRFVFSDHFLFYLFQIKSWQDEWLCYWEPISCKNDRWIQQVIIWISLDDLFLYQISVEIAF